MNIVICTDLNHPFIYGTFLEVLYKKELEARGSNIACMIIGDAHLKHINPIKRFIIEKIGIKEEQIVTVEGLKALSSDQSEQISLFARQATQKIKDHRDLAGLVYHGFQVGIPVLSNLISRTLSITPDIEPNRELILNYIKYSLFTYHAFQGLNIKNNEKYRFYIYNGRSYNTYPITTITPENNTFYYERIDNRKRLQIQPFRIHDFPKYGNLITSFWKASLLSHDEKSKIGHNFFAENFNNIYTEKFEGEKPTIKTKKPYIVFFNSSDDEIASLHPKIKTSHLFADQEASLNYMLDWAARQENYRLVIRTHPHYEKKAEKDRHFWNNISGKNVEVIKSNSSVNSYLLMENADKVITFLSSTGIEATYLGKPSISLGNPIYAGMEAVYEPKSLSDLNILLSGNLFPKQQRNCLPYGFFKKKFGYNFRLLNKLGLSDFEDLADLLTLQVNA